MPSHVIDSFTHLFEFTAALLALELLLPLGPNRLHSIVVELVLADTYLRIAYFEDPAVLSW